MDEESEAGMFTAWSQGPAVRVAAPGTGPRLVRGLRPLLYMWMFCAQGSRPQEGSKLPVNSILAFLTFSSSYNGKLGGLGGGCFLLTMIMNEDLLRRSLQT